MTPQFRFTMYHPTVSAGGTVVTQPLGWKDATISLTRDPKFHSLIEYFKGSFVWYGSARQFIMDVEDIGPDEQLRILIELYISSWVTLFDGLIEVSQLEDISKKETFYKTTAPIIRNDFWAKFINRLTTPVNLQAAVDLDGNLRTAVNKITLPLPNQIVQKSFQRQIDWADNVLRTLDETAIIAADVSGTTTQYLLFSNANVVVDEIEERAEYGTILTTTKPTLDNKYLIKAKFAGEHIFEASIRYTIILSASRTFAVKWYRAIKSEGVITETQIGSTQSGTDSLITDDGARVLSLTTDLLIGDEFYIYGEIVIGSAVGTMSFFPDYDSDLGAPYSPVYTELEITAKTIFQDTTTDAYLLKDAAESILSKITGNDGVLVSNVLDACQGLNAIARGKHIRGYSFTDKAFTMSFDDWWKGAEPILNLGLGYTENADEIEIEVKDEFYDPTPVVFIPNVSNLVRKYDTPKYLKNIEVGYVKWSTESGSGIDDPQTVRDYRTKFATIGQDYTIKSNFYGASLGIEQARRNRIEVGKDDKLDEDICIINVKSDGGGGYEPVLGTDFNAVTGLLNSDTRYNIRHACARILKRWQKFLQGCLAHTTGEYFYFAGGEGNYEMTSQFETTDCEATDDPEPVLAEDQDIAVDETNFDFIPQLYTAKVPMSKSTYDTILANRKRALGISQTTINFLPMHILDLDYKIFGGYAELQLLLANNTPVTPESFILQEDGNMILMEDGTSGILME